MKQKTLSAGAVIVHGRGDARRYLVMRCFQYWDFPKGMVEAGEVPFDAACREIAEETSLTALTFPWGYDYTETPPYSAGKVARYYVASSDSIDVVLGISAELGFPEHDEFRWLPYDDCVPLLGPRVRAVLQWAHAHTAPV